ncbi:MAG: biotin/lipoyl-containing protein, partial [Ilumatobacteraceae bacterium]
EVAVSIGSEVAAGDPVVVIEAMKMLHTLTAAGPGTVEEVRVAVGDQVASNQVLVTFVAADEG